MGKLKRKKWEKSCVENKRKERNKKTLKKCKEATKKNNISIKKEIIHNKRKYRRLRKIGGRERGRRNSIQNIMSSYIYIYMYIICSFFLLLLCVVFTLTCDVLIIIISFTSFMCTLFLFKKKHWPRKLLFIGRKIHMK